MEPVRTGIVGFGRMAENHHLAKMTESANFDVVGVCDITESRRQAAAEHGLRVTGDLAEFLSWDLELVVIATHSAAHHQDALRIAAAGKHMLIEKPLAVNGQEAEEMVAAARDNGVILSVYHNRHFDEDHRLVKAAIHEGLIGEVVSGEKRTLGASPAVGFGVADYNQQWRITKAAGGGTLLDFGPHWVEQALDLMAGRTVVQVYGDVRNVRWGDASDHFRIDMIFDNGSRFAVGKSDIAFASLPWPWFVLGSEATLHGPVDGRVVVNGADYELRRARAEEPRSLHDNVAAHIRGQEELVIGAAHALRVQQVLQAAEDSSNTGKSLDVRI